MMRQRLSLLLILAIGLPVLAFGWMAQRMATEQAYLQEVRYKDLLQARLALLQGQIYQPLVSYEQHFKALVPQLRLFNTEQLRQLIRDDAIIRHVFIVSPDNTLSFPPSQGMSQQEKAVIQRTKNIHSLDLFASVTQQDDAPVQAMLGHQGWYAWHWDKGMNLLYWYRDKQRGFIAFELDVMGLLGDIIGELPDGASDQMSGQLLGSHHEVLYEWGTGKRDEFRLAAQLILAKPLDSWRLVYYVHPDEWLMQTRSGQLAVMVGLAGLILVLLFMGVYLYREFTRNLREAAQRVNFVNQVSHELRTPLTNIRMYAELLQDNDRFEPDEQKKLSVIISESQRLGRLIGNILSYARQQKKTLNLHPQSIEVVALVVEILEQFRPSLAQKKIDMTLIGLTEKRCYMDVDAFSQVLGNLLSNVEKYGKKHLSIDLIEEGDDLIVLVADQGESIAKAQQHKIFHAFYRINNQLTEGVSGTGIGLSISRQLAQRQGGSLKLLQTDQGNVFEYRLPCHQKEAT